MTEQNINRLTKQQCMEQIDALLTANKYTLTVFAIGNRSGAVVPIVDFMPDTHNVAINIVEVPTK